jgi:hypothetical protein
LIHPYVSIHELVRVHASSQNTPNRIIDLIQYEKLLKVGGKI